MSVWVSKSYLDTQRTHMSLAKAEDMSHIKLMKMTFTFYNTNLNIFSSLSKLPLVN